MITRCNLPDSITLPCGAVLKPVIGGSLAEKPFFTEPDKAPLAFGRVEQIIAEAKRRRLKYRCVAVLHRNLRGKLDLHGRQYRANQWVMVEVKEGTTP